MTTMNTPAIINSLDIPLERWLQYAFVSITDFILSAIIIIIATVVLYVGVAHLWGKCWNKDWSIFKRGLLMVASGALISAVCLAAADSLCNGGFNVFSKVAGEVTPAFNDEAISQEDSPTAYKIVTNLVKNLHIMPKNLDDEQTDSEETKYAITSPSARSYSTALSLLRWIPAVFLLLIVIIVPWVSYADIRETHPLSIDKQ